VGGYCSDGLGVALKVSSDLCKNIYLRVGNDRKGWKWWKGILV